MDEFISIDEALEVLFDKAALDDKQKLKRLFQYYSRGKIDFYTELFGRHSRYGVRKNQQESLEGIEKLEGFFKLNRQHCGEYFHELLPLHLGVEFKDNDVEAGNNVIDPYDHHQFYESFSIGLVEDIEGQVWKLKDQEPAEYKGIEVHHTHPIHPQVDDLLIKADQVAILRGAIKPKKEPHNRFDIIDKSNRERMEILGAALAVLSEFRGECVTKTTGKVAGAKVAKLVDIKAQLFWPETLEPPQDKGSIEKIINEWLNKAR